MTQLSEVLTQPTLIRHFDAIIITIHLLPYIIDEKAGFTFDFFMGEKYNNSFKAFHIWTESYDSLALKHFGKAFGKSHKLKHFWA